MKTFVLTDTHIKLLRAANVSWGDCEYGAPAIDPKKPYGNGDVINDIAKIIGLPVTKSDDGEHHPVIAEALKRLHRETEIAFVIVLATGSFEPGTYQADDYSRNWRKVKPA